MCLPGVRIGEAKRPEPLDVFDDPEADLMDEASVDDLVDEHDLHDFHLPGDPILNALDDGRCRLDLDPSVGFRGHGKASKSVSQFAGWADGWVFKKGPLGLGYYVDDPDVVVRAFTTESQSPPHDMVLSYILRSCSRGLEGRTIISLEQLIPDISSSGEACARRPRSTKRRPRRRRKCRSANACEWTPPSCLGVSKLDSSHRDYGVWAIDSINGNTMSTAHAYIASSAADVVCIQESRLAASNTLAAERAARNVKWALSLQPAAITDAGSTSAGVGIAARAHIGMGLIPHLPWFANLDSRLHVRHVAGVCRGGIYVLSAYFWSSIGIAERNMALLKSIAFLIRRLRGPWLLAADWNFSPQVLQESGWLRLVEGKIRSSGVATCKGNELDHFVVAARINHAVLAVARITDTGSGPHSAVRMYIKGQLRKDLVRVVVTPPKADAVQHLGAIICTPLRVGTLWRLALTMPPALRRA